MGSTVLIKGAPTDVPIDVLAYNLDKVFDTDDIGTFRVRELSKKTDTTRRIAVDFKSAFDAFTAQSILHGYKYTWSDGEDYFLQAKIINDPSSTSKDWQRVADREYKSKSKSLLPYNMTSDNIKKCNEMLDSKLELLKKQKLLLQTERELLLEKRKLEREYRRKTASDSEDEIVIKKPSSAYGKRESSSSRTSRLRASPCDESKLKRRRISRSSRSISRSPLRLTSSDHSRSIGRSGSPNNVKSIARYVVQDVSPDSRNAYDGYTRPNISESPDYVSRVRYKSPNRYRDYESPVNQPISTDQRIVRYDSYDLRHKLGRSGSPEHEYKRSERSNSRRRSPSDVYRPKYRSRSRSRSRSQVYARSPEFSHSYTHTRLPSVCTKPARSRSPDYPTSYIRTRSPDESRSYIRTRSPDQSRSYIRTRSPDQSRSYIRARSPDQSRSYIRNRSPDHSRSYIHTRSPDQSRSYNRTRSPDHTRSYIRSRSPNQSRSYIQTHSPDQSRSYIRARSPDQSSAYIRNRSPYQSGSYVRHKSPDISRSIRRRTPITSRSPIRWPLEHSRSHARYRSRSNSSSRSQRKISKYDTMDRTRAISSSDKVRVESIRDEDKPGSNAVNDRTIDTNKAHEDKNKVSQNKTSDHNAEKKIIKNATTANETPISEPTTEHITVKKEFNDNENEITDKQFKLQMNKAIREIQTESQVLFDMIAVTNNLQNCTRRSIMKTWQSILCKRLRQLKLIRFMSKDDIVYEYRNVYSKRDDSLLMQKLMDELSGPKIEVEDIDVVNPGQSNDNADSKIWSIVDEVLCDIEMDYLADDDDSETVIADKVKEESNIQVFDMNDNLDVKIEKPHGIDKSIKTEPTDFIIEDVTHNDINDLNIKTETDLDNEINITITVNAVRSNIKNEQIDQSEQQIHEEKQKQDHNEQEIDQEKQSVDQNEQQIHQEKQSLDRNEQIDKEKENLDQNEQTPNTNGKRIPEEPKFVITVKNILKKMKPHIYDLCKDMNAIRVVNITAHEIRNRVKKIMKGKGYMKSSQITALYREHYPISEDIEFISKILRNIRRGMYINFEEQGGTNSSHNTQRGDDDVIIVERHDVITISEDEDDSSLLEKTKVKRKHVICEVVEIQQKL